MNDQTIGRSTGRFFSRSQRVRAVPIIIILNVLVFAAWSTSTGTYSKLNFMAENFLVSWAALSEGRYWVLMTAAFSHNMFWHLLMNMYVLNSFGPIIERMIGSTQFIKFYLVAGVVSSLSHAWVSAWIMGRPDISALGASGSVSGIILLFSMIFPQQKILIFGLVPISAIWGAILFIGFDVWGLIAQAEGGGLPIGHGAHLGGAVTGIVYYFLVVRRGRY